MDPSLIPDLKHQQVSHMWPFLDQEAEHCHAQCLSLVAPSSERDEQRLRGALSAVITRNFALQAGSKVQITGDPQKHQLTIFNSDTQII